MRHVPLVLLLMIGYGLTAVEAKTEPTVKPAAATEPVTPPAAAPAARQPDPTAAIVAEGRYVYRQRDLDALMLIAARHAKTRFSKSDEERLREVLTTALLAREPFLDALATLPGGSGGFNPAQREALILDLLDYQAEPAKAPAPASAPAPAGTAAVPGAAPGTATTPAAAAPGAAAEPGGPVLVRLPELRLNRTLPGVGKRQLNLTIALFFRDPALAQKLQDRAPQVQDAILSHVQALTPAQFVEPNQLTLKDGITAAIIAKVPDFPPDAVLIPSMEASAGDGSEAGAKGEAPPKAAPSAR